MKDDLWIKKWKHEIKYKKISQWKTKECVQISVLKGADLTTSNIFSLKFSLKYYKDIIFKIISTITPN